LQIKGVNRHAKSRPRPAFPPYGLNLSTAQWSHKNLQIKGVNTMKISYSFATGEKSEIEIAEEWAAVILELDRLDYNADQRETRRHCSLEAFNLDDALFPSDVDVLADVIRSERHGALFAALATLNPSQQELVHQVYFEGKKLVEIAREQGVSHVAVHDRLNRIYKKLKKVLEWPLTFSFCRDLPVKAPTNRLRKGR
jgi:RNA polymerase sigma-70 factor (ECF subfamily)